MIKYTLEDMRLNIKEMFKHVIPEESMPYYKWSCTVDMKSEILNITYAVSTGKFGHSCFHIETDFNGNIEKIINHIDEKVDTSSLINCQLNLSEYNGRNVKDSGYNKRYSVRGKIIDGVFKADTRETILFPEVRPHYRGNGGRMKKHGKVELVSLFHEITNRYNDKIDNYSHRHDDFEDFKVFFNLEDYRVSVKLRLFFNYSLELCIWKKGESKEQYDSKIKFYLTDKIINPERFIDILKNIELGKVPNLLKVIFVISKYRFGEDIRDYNYEFVDDDTIVGTIHYSPEYYSKDKASRPYRYIVSLKDKTVRVIKEGRMAMKFIPSELRRMEKNLKLLKLLPTDSSKEVKFGMNDFEIPKELITGVYDAGDIKFAPYNV